MVNSNKLQMNSIQNKSNQTPDLIKKDEVNTVTGVITVDKLGITLMHEHIIADFSSYWNEPEENELKKLVNQPVSISMLGELRINPFINRDNLRLLDLNTAVEELIKFKNLGGKTVVECTNNGIGRDPVKLQQISLNTDLNIVMGSGYYLEKSYKTFSKKIDVNKVADEIVCDIVHGVSDTGIKAGIIGEIGISKDFTETERKVLIGAARAASEVRVPLSIHISGWGRQGHEVLDIAEKEGADISHTIINHMNPSMDDLKYQTSLAQRGTFIEYDLISHNFYYPQRKVQCPCDKENAQAIKRLIDEGYINKIIISHDLYLKVMLTKFGGLGYGYILRHFISLLKSQGISDKQVEEILVNNPRKVFSYA